jgi:hypothetical protein
MTDFQIPFADGRTLGRRHRGLGLFFKKNQTVPTAFPRPSAKITSTTLGDPDWVLPAVPSALCKYTRHSWKHPRRGQFPQVCRAYLRKTLGKGGFADGRSRQSGHPLFIFFFASKLQPNAYHLQTHIYHLQTHMQQHISHIYHIHKFTHHNSSHIHKFTHPHKSTSPQIHITSTSPSKQVHGRSTGLR